MELLVRIGGLAHGGAFVSSVADAPPSTSHKKVFVRNVAPGELARVRVVAEEKNLLRAELIEVTEPSTERITPPCPYFGSCGGCDLQHLALTAQREAKRSMVEHMLKFQAKLSAQEGVQLTGAQLPGFHYRRRVTFHLSPDAQIGFYRAGSGEVVDLEQCMLASAPINEALHTLRPVLTSIANSVGAIAIEEEQGAVYYLFKLRDEAKFTPGEFASSRSTCSNLTIEQRGSTLFSQRSFREEQSPSYPAGHFSQVNAAANDILVATVVKELAGRAVTELYAGAGNFSIPLAQSGAHVDAIEADEALVTRGAELASEAGVNDRVTFQHTTCEKFLRRNELGGAVLLDPPRSGMKNLLPHFSAAKQNKVVYVSCGLPTLVRDLRALVEAGFTLQRVMVLDMFAQTHHVETVSVLTGRTLA